VSLHIVSEQGPVSVKADEGELFVLLKNLVENAIDFSPAGGTVRIRLLTDRLHVDDEGSGVPPGQQEKVFERFWRGTQGDRPGSGLGLAIVHDVAVAHGWQVRCGSASTGGASFEVMFSRASG
jgi:signal transduction histidine kinase